MLKTRVCWLDASTETAIPALRHRIVLGYRAEADGVRDVDILRTLLG